MPCRLGPYGLLSLFSFGFQSSETGSHHVALVDLDSPWRLVSLTAYTALDHLPRDGTASMGMALPPCGMVLPY